MKPGDVVRVGRGTAQHTLVAKKRETDAAGEPYVMWTLASAAGKESFEEESRLRVVKKAGVK